MKNLAMEGTFLCLEISVSGSGFQPGKGGLHFGFALRRAALFFFATWICEMLRLAPSEARTGELCKILDVRAD
jgi:hypothetical protein